ncbi:MAG: dihydrofolate reductase [Chloroflexota bacterium]
MSQKLYLPRKTLFVAYVATSIDGRIAHSGQSGVDWTSKEDWNFFQKSLNKFDAVIAGRNTYNVAKDSLRKRNTIILTSKVSLPKALGSVTFFNPQKFSLKKFIISKKYKNVAIVGGPKVYNFCLRNKMLDELFITIEPYVFTAGVPMFTGDRFQKYKFVLQSIKRLNKKGAILLKYKIKY